MLFRTFTQSLNTITKRHASISKHLSNCWELICGKVISFHNHLRLDCFLGIHVNISIASSIENHYWNHLKIVFTKNRNLFGQNVIRRKSTTIEKSNSNINLAKKNLLTVFCLFVFHEIRWIEKIENDELIQNQNLSINK